MCKYQRPISPSTFIQTFKRLVGMNINTAISNVQCLSHSRYNITLAAKGRIILKETYLHIERYDRGQENHKKKHTLHLNIHFTIYVVLDICSEEEAGDINVV